MSLEPVNHDSAQLGAPDVIVAGSGAAGLTAALTAATLGLRVVLLERAQLIGGTTAVSGGRVWVPANPFAASRGDTTAAARTYLEPLFDARYEYMLDAFLESVVEMASFVQAHSSHRFAPCPDYPDYHPDAPGATLGGRCLDTAPVHTGAMRLNELVRRAPGYTPVTHAEWERWRYPAAYDRELLAQRARDRIDTSGVALVSSLLDAVVSRGVTIITGARLLDIQPDRGGYRTVADIRGSNRELRARAVVMATGGFEWNRELRAHLIPDSVTALGSPPTNTGDCIEISNRLGVELVNLADGWWMPMTHVEGEEVDGEPFYRGLVRERGAPHQIIVNAAGDRFVDESSPYNEFVKAMNRGDADGQRPNRSAFLICDRRFLSRYPFPGLSPADRLAAEIPHADHLVTLAQRLGINPTRLEATVGRWNAHCAAGADTDFGRGGNPYSRYYGDPDVAPNPSLGAVTEPPFAAAPVLGGVIGTKGGPVTDGHGQLLRASGEPLSGLFAVGNASAFWTADGYPGPGATLGIAMTFGYRAGRHASVLCHEGGNVTGK